MPKHWYRPTKKDAYICDILKSECILVPTKDCLGCQIYKTWRERKVLVKGE